MSASYGRYTVPIITSTPAVNTVMWAYKNGGNNLRLREFGLFNTGVTGFPFLLGRSGVNNFTLTSSVADAPLDPEAGAGSTPTSGGGGSSTFGTAPTLGVVLRRAAIPAAIGGGVIWTWPEGREPVVDAYGLILYAITVGTVCHGYMELVSGSA